MLFYKITISKSKIVIINYSPTKKKSQYLSKTAYYNEHNTTFIKNNTVNHKIVFIFILLCVTIIAL